MIKKGIKAHWGIVFDAIFIVLCAIYAIVNGENIIVAAHDNLDACVSWLKMLSDNHLFFSYSPSKVPFLSGLDRNYLYSNLKVNTWFYMLFPTFMAYVLAWFVRIIVSICSWSFLGKTLGAHYQECRNIIYVIGLIFGILPLLPTVAFGFVYMPFFLGFMVLLYHTKKGKYLIGIAAYALFSDFVYFGIFVCGYLLIFFLIDWIVTKKKKLRILGALAVLSVSYVISEWRLFYILFLSKDITIKAGRVVDYSIGQVCRKIVSVFCHGVYHGGSMHARIVLPVCVIYFCILNIQYIRKKEWKGMLADYYNWAIMMIMFNSVIYGLDNYKPFTDLITSVIPPLKGLSLARTHMFNPFFWYLAFGIVLCRMLCMQKILWKAAAHILCFSALLIVCLFPSTYNHVQQNLDLIKNHAKGKVCDVLTYKEFYSEELFEEIKKDIAYTGEWAVAFGMHPSILQYNGIATLDGYISYYPLEYKEKFRKLIAPALEVDESNREYFDSWGGRAYIFSNEVDYKPVRELGTEKANLRIDRTVFREMNGKYVFSRVEVANDKELGLDLVGKYQSTGSPYEIYVYALSE